MGEKDPLPQRGCFGFSIHALILYVGLAGCLLAIIGFFRWLVG